MRNNPIAAGVRSVFRGPGLVLAEIAWRWCFGIAAWTLIVLTCREYLASIRFTANDWALVRTRQPLLVAEAVAHALQGSGTRLIKASVIVAVALVALWVLAAAVGRAATLKALLARYVTTGFAPLVALHFLRAALTLAAIIGFVGATIVAGYAAPVDLGNPDAVLARVAVFLAIAFAVGCFWSVLSWFLSLAAIFVVREGCDTFCAIAAAVAFYRRAAGQLTSVSLVFGAVRLVAIILATLIAIAPFAKISRGADVIYGLWFAAGVTLVYFFVADTLYIARLAAYVSIVNQEDEPVPQPVNSAPPPVIVPALPDS